MNEVYIFLVILALAAALVTSVGCIIKLISLIPEDERVVAYKAAILLLIMVSSIVSSLYLLTKSGLY